MKKVSSKKITGDMLISDIVFKFPEAAQVLVEDYGFHCIGCFASEMETLEQGAAVHGMDEAEIKVMIESLNEVIQQK